MKKAILTTMLFAAALISETCFSETLIYSLSQHGIHRGYLGIELEQTDSTVTLDSLTRFSSPEHNISLLREIVPTKRVEIDLSKRHRMTRLKIGDTTWDISSDSQEVLVTRTHSGKVVDELGINPVLPVYDLVSFIATFRHIQKSSNFNFYLIDENHEKMLFVEKRKKDNWRLFYDNTRLADIRVRPGGVIDKIDFTGSNLTDMKPYMLEFECAKQSDLQASRTFSTTQILTAFTHNKPGMEVSSGTCKAELKQIPNKTIKLETKSSCVRVHQNITEMLKDTILTRLRQHGVITKDFNPDRIGVKAFTSGSRPVVVPAFPAKLSSAVHDLNTIVNQMKTEIESSVGNDDTIENLKFHPYKVAEIQRDFARIEVPFTFRKRTSKAYTVDLKKRFAASDLPNGETANSFEVADSPDKKGDGVTITGSKKGFFSTKTIGSIKIERAPILASIGGNQKIENPAFDFSKVKNGQLLFVYETSRNESKNQIKEIDFNAFLTGNGFIPQFISKAPKQSKGAIRVQYSFSKGTIRKTKLSLADIAKQILPAEVNNFDRLKLSPKNNQYFLTGTCSLAISNGSILTLLKLPQDASLKISGNRVVANYLDFSCNQ